MCKKRKLHEAVIASTVRSNRIKNARQVHAQADCIAESNSGDDKSLHQSDGGIEGVTISDMFSDEKSSSKGNISNRPGAKKSRKHREDASEFIIPSRPSAAAAAAGDMRLHCVSVFVFVCPTLGGCGT
jgi:hypothetical protein